MHDPAAGDAQQLRYEDGWTAYQPVATLFDQHGHGEEEAKEPIPDIRTADQEIEGQ